MLRILLECALDSIKIWAFILMMIAVLVTLVIFLHLAVRLTILMLLLVKSVQNVEWRGTMVV